MTHTKKWMSNWEQPQPEHNKPTPWNWSVSYPENLVIGTFVDIGACTYLQAEEGIVLYSEVEIGSHVSIYSVNTIDNTRGIVELHQNCKIGSHSVIMPGVTVGKNSVVGAFSLVKEDVPDNVVVAGIPAKVIKNSSD
jgi:Acetyltransferase (isoleucine patch superfamily)